MRRNTSIVGRIRWGALTVALAAVAALFISTAGAQAVVINDNGNQYGVALLPSAREPGSTTAGYLSAAGISPVTSTGTCADPAAGGEPDILSAGSWPLSAPAKPLCWHGGPVMHANETFALEWEGQSPNTYWSTTKAYVQNYLSDVAGNSGQLDSPYADTTQYWDGATAQNRAANSSIFGGGCDDNGTAKCKFGSITGSGPGNPLPSSSDCPVTGDNIWGGLAGGGEPQTIQNNLCVTDSDIQHEVTSLIANDGLIQYTRPGHTPLVTVLTAPGVDVCLDGTGALCSANARLAPALPAVSTAQTSNNAPGIPAGDYEVVITYQTTTGESLPSAPQKISTSGANSTITITSPPTDTNVTGWYAYVAKPGTLNYVRQGGVNSIGTDDTLSSVTGSGSNPPTTPAAFCSYHGTVTDPQSHQLVSYVVQPFTAFTICDEPDVPGLPSGPVFQPQAVEKLAGQALVSPLSQASIASIVNPQLNGWFGQGGEEIDDQNSCQPLGNSLDSFSFGSSGGAPYYLQRESNNASVVDSDLYTYGGCTPQDVLQPTFVAPSTVNLGDTIDLDGSATPSSFDISNANYNWNFGDGTAGVGPSVQHTYGKSGDFTVTLTVTDRGGNQASATQRVQVLGGSGLPGPAGGGSTTTPGGASNGSLSVRLQLLPQGLKSVLNHGITLQVKSTEAANGFATISISRAMARRAKIRTGHKKFVVIGTGTVSQVKQGTVTLHLHLASGEVKKLKHLRHLTMTVRLALVDSVGRRVAVDVAGSY